MFLKSVLVSIFSVMCSVSWADKMHIDCHDYNGKSVIEFIADFPGAIYLHVNPSATTGVPFSKIQDGSYSKTITITSALMNTPYSTVGVQLDTDITNPNSHVALSVWFQDANNQPVASVHVNEILSSAAPGMSASWIVPNDSNEFSGKRTGYFSKYVGTIGTLTRLICAIKE